MRAFLAVAETGSLSAAARRLGLTQPTLSRQIAALEQELDLMLFERVGRGIALSGAGRELVAHAREMGGAADKLAVAAFGQTQTIEGQVRITASDVLSAHYLPAVVAKIQAAAPKLQIDIVAANDIRDLMRREADIALRHVRPEQPDLVARLIQEAEALFYGATSYLDRRGRPATLADFAAHEFVAFGDPEETIGYYKALGIHLTPANFRVSSENGIVAWEMVKSGLGLTAMYRGIGDAEPLTEAVLPKEALVRFPIWLTTHREIHTSPRIRLVFDILADAFGKT